MELAQPSGGELDGSAAVIIRPRSRGRHLMNLPLEIIWMILMYLITPLDDITPLDQRGSSSIKNLSQVNMAFRRLCLQMALRHVRMWKRERNLGDHLADIYANGKHILRNATSLSIRSIGPEPEAPRSQMHRVHRQPRFIKLVLNLQLVLSEMPLLTELRIVTDNGKHTMEAILRDFFHPIPANIMPTVKSLYLRTACAMPQILGCFPNLEAVNFNTHGGTPNLVGSRLTSREWKEFGHRGMRIRTLAILKTANRGWPASDIRVLLQEFPHVERLFVEGSLSLELFCDHPAVDPAKVRHLASLFSAHSTLRHLVLTDEMYHPITRGYKYTSKLVPADPALRWQIMATIFFEILPDLQELCLGRQVDFKAHVFRRIRANPQPITNFNYQVDNPPVWELVRTYADDHPSRVGKERLHFPPARWSGLPCIWWAPSGGPAPGPDEMGVPDEPAGAVTFTRPGQDAYSRPATFITYQEMLRDHCETSFWEAEWLRAVRGNRW